MALDLQLAPEELRLLLEAGYLATERREWVKAKEIFEGIVALGRGADVASVGLANLQLMQSNPKEAEKLLKQAIGANPKNAYAHALLGELLHTLGKKDESLEVLAKAKELGDPAAAQMASAVEEAVNTGVAYKYQVPGQQKGGAAKPAAAPKKK
jgi:tetratricopeptide (TPR) repeat protein